MNLVFITGVVNSKINFKELHNNMSVLNITVGVKEKINEEKEVMHYIDCVAWNSLAKKISNLDLKNGDKITITGTLVTKFVNKTEPIQKQMEVKIIKLEKN